MTHYAYPALFALFVWWSSTALIIYLDNLPRWTFRWSMLGATVLMAASAYGLAASSAEASVRSAYAAFAFSVLFWGWNEIGFYMGIVTGPRKQLCPEGCSGWKHFGHAIQASLWHELAILAGAAIVVTITWGQPNQVGTWTYVVLWWMHQSAKINVLLGVRNLNEELLPDHLDFLRSFLTRKPMNLLFPVSVSVSMVICVMLIQAATAPGVGAFTAAGDTFLATIMALAILEHWFLVLPLPTAALWRLSVRAKPAAQPFDVEIVTGFLGAGKTTVMRRLLAQAEPDGRTVVLVNDFGAVGIDGALLRGQGAEVVELPSGCICCSLRHDLARQLTEIVGRWSPRRVMIEPSGVADVAALLRVLERPEVKPSVRSLRLRTVIDAGAFLADYARMPDYFKLQARLSPTLVVNKADRATPAILRMVGETLRELNPAAVVLPASYGIVAEDAPEPALLTATASEAHPHGHWHVDADAMGMQSWSSALSGPCDPQGLHELLEAVVRGAYGQVERVKGIARAGSGAGAGWIHFDVAGGRSSMAAFSPRQDEQPGVMAIGRRVDEAGLSAAFAACSAAVVA